MPSFEEMDKYLEDSEINSLRTPPSKFDFCKFINTKATYMAGSNDLKCVIDRAIESKIFPCRPIPYEKILAYPLDECHVAKLENVDNTYRLYHYGKKAKGVFRGPNQQLVVESIPIEDEWKYFVGLFVFNEQGYEAAKKDW
ncbi:MAG: hypothetical protein ACOCUI_00130, partial [bacterium]